MLATYNGYFSAVAGTLGAPNATEAFAGIVVADAVLGGVQIFTGLGTGTGAGKTYRRRFIRNPSDLSIVYWDAAWTAENADTTPVGMMGVFPVATPPTGWLVCNGGSFSAATYPALSALLGGTTLPDLRDRTVYGVGTAWALNGSDGLAAGSRGMSLAHVHDGLTGTSGSHQHGISSAGSHSHGGSTGSGTDAWVAAPAAGMNISTAGHTHSVGSDGTHDHGGLTNFLGDHSHSMSGVGANANMTLRGLGLYWIIKAA